MIMEDFEDQLDLLNDDGDGVVEISLLEEEEKGKKGGSNNKSGCCVVFLGYKILWCVRGTMLASNL
jgi:hypothetical protein